MVRRMVRFKLLLAASAGALIGITLLCSNSLMAASLRGVPSTWACHLDALRGAPAVGPRLNGARIRTSARERLIFELAYLVIPPNDSNITGTLYYVGKESCVLSIGGGALTLNNSNGNGTLTLTAAVTGLTDQGNLPCSALFGGQTSLTETFHAIFTENQILLAGDQNFFFLPGRPDAALVPVGGACVPQ
jgi:hypothetical protein